MAKARYVWELSNDWEGKIATCTSYQKAFEVGEKFNPDPEYDFQELLDSGAYFIEKVILDQFYY